jgi:GNAT superfamily N-acetyltransferase
VTSIKRFDIRPGREGELEEAVAIDDSAALLFREWGTRLALAANHPFCLAEQERWSEALREQRLFFAIDLALPAHPLGFAVCDRVDDAPYLDQLAVYTEAMRRGVGSALLAHAITWAARERRTSALCGSPLTRTCRSIATSTNAQAFV